MSFLRNLFHKFGASQSLWTTYRDRPSFGADYKLGDKIGESHLGDIYLAYCIPRQVLVRIEILTGSVAANEESVIRFKQAVELLGSLRHRNLISSIDSGKIDDKYFIVTDYEDGLWLIDLLKRETRLVEDYALSIAVDVAEVLQYLWSERRLLHRDLRPQNIFVTHSGSAKLSGLGIAKEMDEGGGDLSLTGAGLTIGNPEYMSPEQIKADNQDFRSDLYSLGIVMYQALTGELPFVNQSLMLLMQKHVTETPVPVIEKNADVSKGCSALVDKILAKDPDERHQSWDAFITESKALQGEGGT